MNLIDLRYRIENSWNKDTSYHPELWTEENPSLGQCKISALLVHQQLKNHKQYSCRLMKGMVGNSPHWWNEINGVPFDTTWAQFVSPNTITDVVECVDEHILDEDFEKVCFEELKKNFTEIQFAK